MKKRVSGLVVLVSLMVLVLGLGSAMAAMVAPYSSWCTADTGVSYDSGDSYAMATDSDSSAEARADGWTLGAQAEMYAENEFTGGAYAHAEFTQQFTVTAVGTASINFSYDGWLSAENSGSGIVDGGMYGASFSVNASDTLGNSGGDSYSTSGLGEYSPSGTFSLDYNFLDSNIGGTFDVTLTLDAYIEAESITYTGEGGVQLWSDFYNTAEITGTSGVIEPVGGPPVPIPGALWLLGSGLFGLVAVRRRQGRE